MRLVRVAKALGMTGQELRRELEQVNFGVKPADREVPDKLAQGIIRFLSHKRGIEVDMEALGFPSEEQRGKALEKEQEEEGEEGGGGEINDMASASKAGQGEGEKVGEGEGGEGSPLHVLRKLTLEDVSKEAIKEQEKKEAVGISKEEREEFARAEKVTHVQRKRRSLAQAHQEQIKEKEGRVVIPAQVSVKEFAEKTGIQVPRVIGVLMSSGIMATINQTIDYETAAIVASELGVEVQREQELAKAEDLLQRNLEELLRDEPENLVERPPIVVVMGHVDHGKTSILDVIRETDTVTGEAGGITQHIGAYQVEHVPKGSKESHKITFLDTPGHEAFTAMRARGAQVTDIAIIVVAAEEGVKPTTVEAIHHAKEAGVPILVALNKMDKEGADPDRVKRELLEHDLLPEEWGGKTPVISCSAKTKQGIDDLLDALVIMSQELKLRANPNRSAVATVIESHLDPSLGPIATVVVNAGTLRGGEVVVCGATTGKVRTMVDAHGKRLSAVGPSGAVRISGFQGRVKVGDILQMVASEHQARVLVEELRSEGERQKKASFVDLVSRLSEGKLTQLKVVLKADTQGSLEALKEALAKQVAQKVSVKIIHSAVGVVTESDILMASASGGVVIAFTVPVPVQVLKTAEREGVEIRQYDVVYSLLDDVEALIQGLVEPEEEERIIGRIEILAVFMTHKSEQVVGGRVREGAIKRLPFRIFRDDKEVGTGRVISLRHGERDVKESKEGSECGVRVETATTIEVGDTLEVYLKELKRKEGKK